MDCSARVSRAPTGVRPLTDNPANTVADRGAGHGSAPFLFRLRSSAEIEPHDFRRHPETRRYDAGAEATRHNQVPALLDDVAVGETRAVLRRHKSRPDQRHADLSAVSMP